MEDLDGADKFLGDFSDDPVSVEESASNPETRAAVVPVGSMSRGKASTSSDFTWSCSEVSSQSSNLDATQALVDRAGRREAQRASAVTTSAHPTWGRRYDHAVWHQRSLL